MLMGQGVKQNLKEAVKLLLKHATQENSVVVTI